MSGFLAQFPNHKVLIAMAHVPPLPGTPLYDQRGSVKSLIESVARDSALLLEAGVDALLFFSEDDRPYQLHAGLESAAVMARS